MEHVFLTRKNWCRFGGVPGLCLTLQEIGVPRLNLHGPPGIDRIFDSTRKFVVLRNMRVETPKCEEGGFYEDSVLRVTYVPLHKSKVESVAKPIVEQTANQDWSAEEKNETTEEIDFFGYESNSSNGKSSVSPSRQTENTSIEPESENMVMAYICKLQERPGTLDFSKCVDRGVQPGPLLGRLKNGFDVTLPSGEVVKADDVRGPASPGSVFVFVDIPDESYLPALKNCKAFEPHKKSAAKEEDAALVIVHFSSEEMMENSAYKEWIDEFSHNTKHWFVNERNEFTGFFASHRIQRQLNEIDNNVFPILKETHPYLRDVIESDFKVDSIEEHPSKKFKVDKEGEQEKPDRFKEYPELGMLSAFHIRPPKGFDRNLEPYSNPEKVMEDTFNMTPDLKGLIDSFKEEAKKLIVARSKAERAKEYPKIITFGTGSCIPNKTRNVSANLVHIADDNCVLMDCGEGTLGQLVRFYGRDGADEVLKNLRMIYISHLHADHHLGLFNILNRRRQLTNNKVLLLAPTPIYTWLSFYNFRIEEIFSTFDLLSCNNVLNWNMEDSKMQELYDRLGLVKMTTCLVKHCPFSFGIAIEMKNLMKSERYPKETVKVTYSGDTLPCEELVNIGMNSDVLIHEATMEDDLEKEARIKMHSTVSQAINIGRQMKAKFVILTHFSQRYAKIPLMEKNVENVAIGFDNMEVTLNDLPMMHLMYEPLKLMFSDHFELMEQKTLKRKYQMERKINIDQPTGNKQNKITKFASSDED